MALLLHAAAHVAVREERIRKARGQRRRCVVGSTYGDPLLQLPSVLTPELGSGCSRPQLELAANRLQQGAPRGLFLYQTSSGMASSLLL